MMNINSRILITGGYGLVGEALREFLIDKGFKNLLTPRRAECELRDFQAVKSYFEQHQPEYVFHLAAAVYGIMGNMQNKGSSFFDNVMINTHVVEASRLFKIKKITAMGTGAAYPYPSPGLPLKEDMIWQGRPHGAEDSYGQAKRAMLAQLEAYRESDGLNFSFVISGNLYGPHDKFDIHWGHVTPALVRKFFEAKRDHQKVSVWGNGSAKRDFLYAKDVALALFNIMNSVEGPVNMASGEVHSIRELVDALAEHTGMTTQVEWDETKPNGQDYRAYDLTKLFSTGFKPMHSFKQAICETYDWYAAHAATARS